MKFIEQLRQIERVDQLIRLKATGKAKDLAERLEMSERNVYYLMNIIRELGVEVYYCEYSNSYRYKGNFRIQFLIKSIDNSGNITGGEKKVNIFSLLQNLCSEPAHLCSVTLQSNGKTQE